MNLLWRILKKVFSSVFLATVTLVGAPVAFGVTVLAGLIFLPLPATIPVPKSNPTIQPTIIYDRYGNPIATMQQFDRNIPVTEAEIPAVLKEAIIADEDRNYYHHGGVDLRGTLRAIWADLRNRAPVQGGSTITQQYVKLAYTNAQRTIVRKVREAILASQLAREASKDEILYRYMTLIYLGDGNYGVGAAAATYFHVPVNKLNASQAATLAGLIPAPSSRAPEEHISDAEVARELVLKKMLQQRYLTAAQYKTALSERLVRALPGVKIPRGATVVYPLQGGPTRYPDFVDYVERWLLAHFPSSEVYGGGLRVQTTLDPKIQEDAYAAVGATLSGSTDPTEMALASVQPQTGFVEALVGGRHFTTPLSQVNLALPGCPAHYKKPVVSATCWAGGTITGGSAGFQPGSSWKPFVLATAFEQGIQPTARYFAPGVYQIPNCLVTPTNDCQIHNDEPNQVLGNISLDQATWDSVNTVYAQVGPQVGCPNVATTAKKLGITQAFYATPPVFFCQSYSLGEFNVSPLDMASAYGVFDNHGQRAEPTPILEIVNAQGKVLVNNIHPLPKTTSVLSTNVADNVTNVLTGVIKQGTGTAAQLGRPAAGKTGTTSNYTNAWFVGYTPTLSTAVWMGNEKSSSTSLGYVSGRLLDGSLDAFDPVYGGTWPAITWKEFMSAALAGVPVTPFSAPAPIVAPKAAAVLQEVGGPTTTLPVEPGPPGSVDQTPAGGPYTYPPTAPVAPPPPASVPTTTTVTGTRPGRGRGG
jgi:penicillin-binding protein 1A